MLGYSFSQTFSSLLKASAKLSAIGTFLPKEYPNESQYFPAYLSLLSGGKVTMTYPFLYDMERLDAFCIIYTENGSGYLCYENRTYYLDPNSLVFFDCHKLHHIEIQHSPWEYKILYLKGTPLCHFYEIFSQNKDIFFFVGKSSYLPGLIDKIFTIDYNSDYYTLMMNRKLTDFLTELTIEKKHGYLSQNEIKSHIAEMKYMFDSNYSFHYSLEWLEDHFKISRYRLCREFKAAEGISPIAYLNSIRINTAKNMLLNTQLRINEIACAVGFDNTNHFIRLFKTSVGKTPSKYRG